jgi:hypothetical protein
LSKLEKIYVLQKRLVVHPIVLSNFVKLRLRARMHVSTSNCNRTRSSTSTSTGTRIKPSRITINNVGVQATYRETK